MRRILTRAATGTAATALMLVGLAGTASAHPHQVSVAHQGTGQVLADGQNHGAYTVTAGGRETCGGDPAAYGLETAHHGPDAGTAGKADGCFEVTGTPATDVASPVIR
ncbi:MAG TPA: hypothetical protein VM097_08500 [Mycobacteriales bacterium]|nr:hypothetical protein [Mycobacteriales bacterium]